MNTMLRSSLVLALALPLLAACQETPPPPAAPSTGTTAGSGEPETFIGRSVQKAIAEAREELRRENISISDGPNINVNGHEINANQDLPKAEITPQGDLLIEGKPVAISPEQRQLLLEYRGDIIGVVEVGMAMGVKGADLAGQALSETLSGLLSGDTAQIEAKIEAEASKLEAEAVRLCAQLPPMLDTQQRLAASLPAFQPYATMTQEDIDDCGKDGEKGAAVTSS